MKTALNIIISIAFFVIGYALGEIICSGFNISLTVLLALAILLAICITVKQKEDKENEKNVPEKSFFDIDVGDKVVVYDEYSHDYIEHVIKVNAIEYDDCNATETNPKGMACYGKDLDWWDEELQDYVDDNYITIVTEGNFIRFYKEEK